MDNIQITYYIKAKPPFTCMVWPVIYDALSEHKKPTVLVISSGLPSFFIGILSKIKFFWLSFSFSVILDCIKPGATLFTVIFLLETSKANDLTKPDIAAFDEV